VTHWPFKFDPMQLRTELGHALILGPTSRGKSMLLTSMFVVGSADAKFFTSFKAEVPFAPKARMLWQTGKERCDDE
jgi:hypothetical protein